MTLKDGIKLDTAGGITTLRFRALDSCAHGFSTRTGGVSSVPFSSLNMGFNRPEPRENILENYRRFCSANGLDFHSLVLAAYAHGTNVEKVEKSDMGRGIDPDLPPLPDCDGIVTNDPDVTLLTLHADCLAYFVFDPVHRAIGLAHAGWRGTLGGVGRNVIESMRMHYGTDPKDCVVCIGPGICGDCYEVGDDVADEFEAEYGAGVVVRYEDRNPHIDITAASRLQFIRCGVPEASVHTAGLCTYESEELFFSYRRDGKIHGKTGAMCAYMRLRP